MLVLMGAHIHSQDATLTAPKYRQPLRVNVQLAFMARPSCSAGSVG